MKKSLIILALFLLPYQSQAAGVYDGVWQVTADIFVTINQNGSSLAAIVLQDTIWEAQMGELNGNVVVVETVYGYVDLSARIVFNTTTSATITILSCVNGESYVCLFQPGTVLPATKIF